MRVHEITCPHCGSGMKSKAGIQAGQTIPCPKCKKKFAVEPTDEVEVVEDFEVEEPAPRKKTSSRKPVRRIEDDETEEEEPVSRKKAKRRPVEDTEEEEVPRKKKKKKVRRDDDEEMGAYQKLKSNVLVRVITLVVLLGILAVVSYLFYEHKIKEQPDNTPPAKSGQNDLE